jgi:hypothetical protein
MNTAGNPLHHKFGAASPREQALVAPYQITGFICEAVCYGRTGGLGLKRGTGVDRGVVFDFALTLQTDLAPHRRKLRAGRDAFALGVEIDPQLSGNR